MKIIKLLPLLIISLSLISCKRDMTDLDQFFSNIKNIPPQQIEDLPEINSPEIFLYETNDERDPFSNDLQILREQKENIGTIVEGEGPDLNRRKESLETYPLDGLYMVGTYLQEEDFWGLIEDPEGDIHRVSQNQYLGQNYGKVSKINEGKIYVSEWITDGLGGWTKREASIALREK